MRVDYIYKMIIQFDVYLFKINTIFKFFKNKIVNSRVPPIGVHLAIALL